MTLIFVYLHDVRSPQNSEQIRIINSAKNLIDFWVTFEFAKHKFEKQILWIFWDIE